MIIRVETAEDFTPVRRVNEAAFGQPGEAALVDALRKTARPYVSLVAEVDGRIVGHIFFSPVTVEPDVPDMAATAALALGPMAVLPESQRSGVGSRLVEEGLKECLRLGFPVVFVVGHPGYYPRFGFVPAGLKKFKCVYDVPDEVFMVLELSPGASDGRSGLVRYLPEFDGV